jgi:pentatricopeptide repeat protein
MDVMATVPIAITQSPRLGHSSTSVQYPIRNIKMAVGKPSNMRLFDHVGFNCHTSPNLASHNANNIALVRNPEGEIEAPNANLINLVSTATDQEVLLVNRLVKTYTQCSSLADGHLIFDQILPKDIFSWNLKIGEYIKQGQFDEALNLYCQMYAVDVDIKPDEFTFTRVLKACAAISALRRGKEIHERIIKSGFSSHVFVGNALISMYSKCKRIEDARKVFNKMSEQNVVSWNAMIVGYAQNDRGEEALELFRAMQSTGTAPDSATMACVIPACARLAALQQGKEIHAYAIRRGFGSDTLVGNSLIDMYAKCGSLTEALLVFEKFSQQSVVSWTAAIRAYASNGNYVKALELFYKMNLQGLNPDVVTLTSILSVCAQSGALQHGKHIHDYITRYGFDSVISVENALIDMYVKCGNMEDALCVFCRMSQRDAITWNTIIAGYSQNAQPDEALQYFRQMQLTLKPNPLTISCVLPACTSLAALQQGKEIHGYTIRNDLLSDVVVGNALTDMYAKCGSIKYARKLFDNLSQKDVVSWTIMIAGYSMNGQGKDALLLFDQMQKAGVMPNHITFIAILYACSHAGLVEEGWKFFNLMSLDWHIIPKLEHYACMVDLLCHAGCLDEAYNFIKGMPLEPDASIWGTLLEACKTHCNIEVGELVADRVFELEPENARYHVTLSNIYAEAGRWKSLAKVRNKMNAMGVRKNPGCSWIVVRNRVHAFPVGDRSHPQAEKIYGMLESLAKQIKEEGFVPIMRSH